MRTSILVLLIIKLLCVENVNAAKIETITFVRDSIKVIYRYGYGSVKHPYLANVDVSSPTDSLNIKRTFYMYPADYVTGAPFIDTLVANRVLTYPIEQYDRDLDGYVSGTIIKFYPDKRGLKESELSFEANGLVQLGAFMPSKVSGGVFQPGPSYKTRVTYNSYDAQGNLLEDKVTGGTSSTYIWGYNNQYPIAKVSNAMLKDVGYTSFEPNSKGTWTFAGASAVDNTVPMGKQCYALQGGALSKSGLTTGKYYLSYWKKTGATVTVTGATVSKTVTGRVVDGWTYMLLSLSVTGSVSISGSGYIDEVRLHPQDAQMTSSAYQPLVGVISIADTRGNTAYYEYDGLQRLKYERDQDKNIIKSYEINYKR